MTDQSEFELEVAALVVETLNIEDIEAADIDPQAPMFGEGLGLDSIDALELALAISRSYGFQLRADDENNSKIFSTLGSLSQHIEAQRTT